MTTKKMQEKKAPKKAKKATEQLATERVIALKYEKTGEWSRAFDCWARIARTTKSSAEKKEAAGRAAAAKVRAEAKPTQSAPLDDQLAESKTADANARSWDSAMPEPGYVPPPGSGNDDEDADEGADNGATTTAGAPTGEQGAPGAAISKRTRKAAEPASARERDARLPAVGTVLKKVDRNGNERVRSTIVEGGIDYAGATYASLSGAAMAAAKDLGLTNKTQNGFVFWGLSKPPRRPSDPLLTLERAWERYHDSIESIVKDGVTDENRSDVISTIRKHAQVIESLRERVA